MSRTISLPPRVSALPSLRLVMTAAGRHELTGATVLDDWISALADGWLRPPASAAIHPRALSDVTPLMDLAALLHLQGRRAQALVS